MRAVGSRSSFVMPLKEICPRFAVLSDGLAAIQRLFWCFMRLSRVRRHGVPTRLCLPEGGKTVGAPRPAAPLGRVKLDVPCRAAFETVDGRHSAKIGPDVAWATKKMVQKQLALLRTN